jgi:outer membrane protein TolC
MEAGQFANMFKSDAWSGSVGPAFRWNVLNYGRLVNLVDIQDAILQQRIAAYQQQVLLANEEAENSIVGFLRYHDEVGYLVESVREAQQAERVSQLKYNQGAIDYNRLFTVQTLLVQQQDAMATARGNSALSVVELYRAMGGGWEIRLAPPEAYATPEFAPQVAPQPGEPVPVPAPVPMPEPVPPAVP